MKRKIYLKMKSLEEARRIWLERFQGRALLGTADVPLSEALHRITAEPVFSARSSPPFHGAAMDGVAVRAEDTFGAGERTPKRLKIGENAFWINTGRPLPEGCNAVIMAEKLHEPEPGVIEIYAAAYPWQHVRKVGEDVVATELLFPRNHRIRAFDLGALIGGGIHTVRVYDRPRVCIIPTGDELVPPEEAGRAEAEGRIPDSNSTILAGLVTECGGIPEIHSIVPDDPESLRQAVDEAVRSPAHLVLINAGSSAGSEDYTYSVLDSLGEVLVHGVAMMPGKPTILAEVAGKPVVGNPGYSVSATLSFDQFVRPLLYTLQGVPEKPRKRIRVRLSRAIPSKLGLEEFIRVHMGKVGEHVIATPLPRGAGSITTLTRAEGMIRIPELSQGLDEGREVEAELLVKEADLRRTLVVIGSHDLSIDVLADLLKKDARGFRLSSANVGSLGGLLALRNGHAHVAGCHLLDTETGEYNRSYVERHLKGTPVTLFHLVEREQGLIVPKGNPKNIRGLQDLVRDDVRFVNRQGGSGTRILLDYRLEQEGIDPDRIHGYHEEEYTHMTVAVAVKSGAADVGMGIFAAAKALDLDFIPLVKEEYDLAVPSAFLEDDRVRHFLATAESELFRKNVEALGGYNAEQSGRFKMEIG